MHYGGPALRYGCYRTVECKSVRTDTTAIAAGAEGPHMKKYTHFFPGDSSPRLVVDRHYSCSQGSVGLTIY